MSFRQQIYWTIVLQGGGAIASLGAVLLLGYCLGPSAQGEYSLIKIEIGFIGSLAIFGLTQALFYFIESLQMSVDRALRFTILSTGIGGGFAFAYGLQYQFWESSVLLIFVLAGMAYAGYGCLRGIVLAAASTRKFNFLTALPQVILLFYAAAVVITGKQDVFYIVLAFFLSYAFSSFFALSELNARRVSFPHIRNEVKIAAIARFGLASGVSEIAASLALVSATKSVEGNLTPTDLGVFTMGVAVCQGVLIPLSFVTPLLFKRWVSKSSKTEAAKGSVAILFILLVLAGVVWLAFDKIARHIEFGEYGQLPSVLWIFVIGVAFDGYQKTWAAFCNSQGAPWLPATAELVRATVIVIGVSLSSANSLPGIAWIISGGAFTSALIIFAFQYKKFKA